jgi:succinoglycan biosynthesis transport protein ExoP
MSWKENHVRKDRELAPRTPIAPSSRRQVAWAHVRHPGSPLETAELVARCRLVVARRWPAMLTVFLAVMTAVIIGSLLRQPVYRASGVIEIRPERTGAVSVDTLFGSQRVTDDMVRTEVGLIKSATLAGRVVDDLGLVTDPEFTPGRSWMAWLKQEPARAADANRREHVIQRVLQQLDAEPQENSRLVNISFMAHDRELAARVVNGVLDAYVKRRIEDSNRSAEFLSTQIADAQRQLDASERRLQAHVRQRGLQIIETGKGESQNLVNDRLRQLHLQLADVQAERYAKQSAFEEATKRGPRTVDDQVVQSLTVRLAELEREYASLSATFHDEYPKVQQVKEQIKQVKASLDEESRRGLDRLNAGYQAALRREALLQGSLASQQATAIALTGDTAGYETLKREVATNQHLYAALDQKLKEVTIANALKATDVGIIDRAAGPRASSTTSVRANLALGAFVAAFLAVGFAFLREHLDRSVRTIGDVDLQLGVPALAAIPAIQRPGRDSRWLLGTSGHVLLNPGQEPAAAKPAWARIDHSGDTQAILNEAFAALRTSVVLADNAAGPPRRLLITSSQAGEGKTTIAINLAISLSRLGERVLLVDADLRQPRIHDALNLAPDPGLSTYLVGGRAWRDCLQPGPLPNLDVLAGGRPAAEGSAELASSPLLRRLLDDAEEEYDFIILDSPAVLMHSADVRTLAALADGTLLAVRSGSTPRETVWQALSQLRHTLGIVLNGMPLRDIPDWYRDIRFRSTED